MNIHWKQLTGFVLVSEMAGILGSLFTRNSIPNWYAFLTKPSFNPPNWLFGPVWTTLYFLQGLAAFLVWEKAGQKSQGKAALRVFWLQLFLNFLWTPAFFGLQNLSLAFAGIILMWLAIVWTIYKFWNIRRFAALLLVPYLAWVSFAATLNYFIWQLNK